MGYLNRFKLQSSDWFFDSVRILTLFLFVGALSACGAPKGAQSGDTSSVSDSQEQDTSTAEDPSKDSSETDSPTSDDGADNPNSDNSGSSDGGSDDSSQSGDSSTDTPTDDNGSTPPPSGESDCKEMNELACELFRLVNHERTSRGIPALVANSNCIAASQYHAEDMAKRDYFSHNSPEETVWERFARFGITSGYRGENIIYGSSSDLQTYVDRWMNSSGHRSNILSTKYKTTGVGVALGGSRLYAVQCFWSGG